MYLFPKFPESFLSHVKFLFDDNQEEKLRSIYSLLKEEFNFEAVGEYIENVIFAALKTQLYQGERLPLPMIDDQQLSKHNALPYFLWGLLYEDWQPVNEENQSLPEADRKGVTVFLQGYAERGPNNHRKKAYFSALTPDLYSSKYQEKVTKFFGKILDPENADKPLMRLYLDNYFYLYWNLHLGVERNDVPDEVLEIGQSFNTVLAYLNPLDKTFYHNYMRVRDLRQTFQDWVDEGVTDMIENINAGQDSDLDRTFVYYWLKNSDNGNNSYFDKRDIAFECFHNFLALSQWGNTIYKIISKLCSDSATGDPVVKNWFKEIMSKGNYDELDGSFTPLDRFVMELFRVISPNSGSISTIKEIPLIELLKIHSYSITPHEATSEYFIHWDNPTEFDPDRYKTAPTSDQMDKTKSQDIGFAQCPFHKEDFVVEDGRENIKLTNSIFGTVYAETENKSYPVCDSAGYAPFGFGYRRCPGEQFTVEVIKDFLRNVWNNNIQFNRLDLTKPEEVPVGPKTIVSDDIGFSITV